METLIAKEKIEVGDFLIREGIFVRKWKEGDPLNDEQKAIQEDWKNQTRIFNQ